HIAEVWSSLSIVEHAAPPSKNGSTDGQRYQPSQRLSFADRSPVAGAGLLSAITMHHIMPALVAQLADAGHRNPQALFEGLANGNGQDLDDRHIGTQLIDKVIRPAAIGALEIQRGMPEGVSGIGLRSFRLPALVHLRGGSMATLPQRLNAVAARHGAPEFQLDQVAVPLLPSAMAKTVERYFKDLLDRVAEVVSARACDLLLLGGPYGGVVSGSAHLLNSLPFAPHRIVDMTSRQIPRAVRAMPAADDRARARLLPVVGAALANRLGLDLRLTHSTGGLAGITATADEPQTSEPRP
ncbi:MAG: virulence factor SrfB, partial [Hyphomicrobiaceae bacterium]|nr:virulence factor SrfB [Hyphomicrobiaceae bacterium]